jgi:hypothetical protein
MQKGNVWKAVRNEGNEQKTDKDEEVRAACVE